MLYFERSFRHQWLRPIVSRKVQLFQHSNFSIIQLSLTDSLTQFCALNWRPTSGNFGPLGLRRRAQALNQASLILHRVLIECPAHSLISALPQSAGRRLFVQTRLICSELSSPAECSNFRRKTVDRHRCDRRIIVLNEHCS